MHTTPASQSTALPDLHRPPTSALERTAAVALVAAAGLVLVLMAVAIREFIPPIAGIAALGLVLAALIRRGRRWPAAIGAVYALLLSVLGAMQLVSEMYDLGSPSFRVLVPLMAATAVAVVAGVAAAVQNWRSATRARPTPRWLVPAVSAVGGIVLGALALAAVPRVGAAVGVSDDVLAGLPTVTLRHFEFDQHEVRVKAGTSVALHLRNEDAAMHTFEIDELGVHTVVPAGGQALALFQAERPGRYTIYCRPHYDRSAHDGMHATLIVE